MKKKIIIIVSVLIIVIVSVTVGIYAYAKSQQESYHTEDIAEYGIYENHMAMEYEMMQSELMIFPDNALVQECGKQYIYDCGVLSMAANYYFVYVECEYDSEQLQAEIERLQQIEINYDHTTKMAASYSVDADTTIYVTTLEENGSKEYAIVNGSTIQYVLNRYNDSLEKKYIDKQYRKTLQEWDKETEDYTIYYYGKPYELESKS